MPNITGMNAIMIRPRIVGLPAAYERPALISPTIPPPEGAAGSALTRSIAVVNTAMR